jgi:ABC-type uncharacterized transport system involved in gliding motility auxiliary subunit
MRTSTKGKILGALGLVALLSSPFTYFLTAHSLWLAGAKAVVGLLLIGAFFATNVGELGQVASRKSSFFFGSSAALVLIVLGGLVAMNYIAAKKNTHWDLTRQKLFTLAPQTQATLKGLGEKVTAIGFIPADHPAYEQLETLFRRYHDVAPDKFDFTFKDPMRNPDLAAKYELKEGQATVVLTRRSGANESHTSLNVISEQELTNALVKLDAAGTQKVYFLAGHGEWSLDGEGGQSLSELERALIQEGYAPTPLNLAGQSEVPRDAAAVVIAGPKSKVTDPEQKALASYLDEGGRMLVFAEAGVEPTLNPLLEKYGVQVDKGVLADDHYAVQSPYLLLSNFFAEHEITHLLKSLNMNLQLPMTVGLTVLHQGLDAGVKVTPVVLTSEYAWEESTPDNDPKRSNGEKTGKIPVVVAATKPTASAAHKRYDQARLAVFGESEMLVDANWGYEPNRNLVLNALGWASNQVQKITIRPPDPEISSLDIQPAVLGRIRFATADLLPLSLLGVGLAIWLKRRNQ